MQKSGLWDLGLSQPGVYGTTVAKGINVPDWPWLKKNIRGTDMNQFADIYLRSGNPCIWHGWNGCEDNQAWILANYLYENTIVIGGLGDDDTKLRL